MDTGAVRVPATPTASPAVRSPNPVAEPATRTEIAPEKAVQPSQESVFARPAAENGAENGSETRSVSSSSIKREEYRDTITDSLVFRAIDTETGEVVRQIPEESLLRLRRAFAETTHQDMTGLGVNRSL